MTPGENPLNNCMHMQGLGSLPLYHANYAIKSFIELTPGANHVK